MTVTAAAADEDTAPRFHFKRRKTVHTKRTRTDDSFPTATVEATPTDAPALVHDGQESGLDLKEILRNRKRARDRPKETVRRPQVEQTGNERGEEQSANRYTRRFIAQTGQVVDSGDAQINTYVEARLAAQNHRSYGWPIPAHLQATVAAIAPDLKPDLDTHVQSNAAPPPPDDLNLSRNAAGQGRLEEVVLSDAPRSHSAWHPPSAPKVRLGRNGKPIRSRKRRSSSDARRDAAVDAVLSEAKISYFDDAPAAPRSAVTDEDMLAQFRDEYLEAAEERAARKPAVPVTKYQPKGPKLGGSRSARAAMREAMGVKGAVGGEGKGVKR